MKNASIDMQNWLMNAVIVSGCFRFFFNRYAKLANECCYCQWVLRMHLRSIKLMRWYSAYSGTLWDLCLQKTLAHQHWTTLPDILISQCNKAVQNKLLIETSKGKHKHTTQIMFHKKQNMLYIHHIHLYCKQTMHSFIFSSWYTW